MNTGITHIHVVKGQCMKYINNVNIYSIQIKMGINSWFNFKVTFQKLATNLLKKKFVPILMVQDKEFVNYN